MIWKLLIGKQKEKTMQHSIETINFDKLRKLKTYVKPPTYHLQKDPGNGCYLDPPGYPTYFTRAIYTQHGNHGRGPKMVLFGVVVDDGKISYENLRRRLEELYVPLPFEHPRVQCWIKALFTYFKNCYLHPTETEYGRKKTVIYPVPDYELKHFFDDERFSDEWRKMEKASIAQYNKELQEERRKICTVDNHSAVVKIRRWYPDFVPTDEMFEANWRHQGDWWERFDRNFTPEECPGKYGAKHGQYDWCQMCGWRKSLDE